MIIPKEWTKEQKETVDLLLNRIIKLCRETWENDEDFTVHYFLDNVSLTEKEMETIKEIEK